MNGPDTRTLLVGSTDYPAWRTAYERLWPDLLA